MQLSNIAKNITLLLLLFTHSFCYAIEPFKVDSAEIINIGNGYNLNAKIHYPLNARVIEALQNSVPIVFSQQLKLVKTTSIINDFWQWDSIIWVTEMRYEIRYHALTRHYILKNLNTAHQSSFPRLSEALAVLGHIRNMTLPPQFFTQNEGLTLFLRTELDLHALPTPMRPGALISDKWNLTSTWKAATWL